MRDDDRNPMLNDEELDALLPQWKAPKPSPALRQSLFGKRRNWWQRLWRVRVSLPVPAFACLLLLLAAGAWRWAQPQPVRVVVRTQTVVRTERVEVPVVAHERQGAVPATDNKRRKVALAETFDGLQPVSAFKPRVVRGYDEQN